MAKLVLGMVAMSVLALPMATASATPGATSTTSAKWSVNEAYAPPLYSFGPIACATAADCEAIGQSVTDGANGQPIWDAFGTTDGGSTWTAQSLPASVFVSENSGIWFNAIACATTTDCEVVGGTSTGDFVLGTIDGGATWSVQRVPTGQTSALSGVACFNASTCEAVGSGSTSGFVLGTTNANAANGDAIWGDQKLPATDSDLISVSCASASTCEAIGNESNDAYAFGTTDANAANNTATWTAQAFPATTPMVTGLTSVSCASTSTCEAVGQKGFGGNKYPTGVAFGTTNGGATWTAQSLPAWANNVNGYDPGLSISCASTSICEAVGTGEYPTGAPTGVALGTTNDGVTWTAQRLPTNLTTSLVGVTCPTTSSCEAAGTGPGGGLVLAETDGGTAWTQQSLPTGPTQLNDISCATVTSCQAVGYAEQAAMVLGSTTANTAPPLWSTTSFPNKFNHLDSVSCPTASTCEALQGGIATSILRTTDANSPGGAATWKAQHLPAGFAGNKLNDIACATASDCEAVGNGTLLGTTNGGSTWESQDLPPGVTGPDLFGVACPTAGACVAVGWVSAGGGVILGTTNADAAGGDAIWNLQSDPGLALASVSCATASDCEAVGSADINGGHEGVHIIGTTNANAANGNATWTSQSIPTGVNLLFDVSCATASTCEAVGGGVSDVTGQLDGLAIRTTNANAAKGAATWIAQSLPSKADVLTGVTCVKASTTCLAVGSDTPLGGGIILTYK